MDMHSIIELGLLVTVAFNTIAIIGLARRVNNLEPYRRRP